MNIRVARNLRFYMSIQLQRKTVFRSNESKPPTTNLHKFHPSQVYGDVTVDVRLQNLLFVLS